MSEQKFPLGWDAERTKRLIEHYDQLLKESPMAITLAEHCVYTIVQGGQLATAARTGGSVTFPEGRTWKTGLRLWRHAQAEGEAFAVLFGDATDCSRLEYWGLITEIELVDEGTSYTVECIRKLTADDHKPQELVLQSSGKRIAPGFIKPYAICRTPDFLVGEVEKSQRPKRRKQPRRGGSQ
jgi:hypothetical protein